MEWRFGVTRKGERIRMAFIKERVERRNEAE
jgi:hypothetical protein